jgi:hypothetical protein
MARFYSMFFWLEVKIFLQDTLQKLKLICKNYCCKKNPFDLISTGVQKNANHLVDMSR